MKHVPLLDTIPEAAREAEAWLLDLVRQGQVTRIGYHWDAQQNTLYFDAFLTHELWTANTFSQTFAHIASFEKRFGLRITLHLSGPQAHDRLT